MGVRVFVCHVFHNIALQVYTRNHTHTYIYIYTQILVT